MAAVELFHTPLFNDPTLQAYYRFEGNSNDSKNSNNGTDTDVTYSIGNGKFGEGVGFDEDNTSNVTSPYNIPYGDFSVTFWVKGTSSGFPSMFVANDMGSNEIFQIGAGNTGTGIPTFFVFDNASNISETDATTNVFDGSFHMVTCTVNSATGEQLIYVDGVVEGTPGMIAAPFNASVGMVIGNPFDDPGTEAIDDLAVFTSVLTADDISNLYNGTFPPSGPTGNPAFILNFI